VLTELAAWVRRKVSEQYASGPGRLAMNPRGDLSVAQGLPPAAELVRMGDSWAASIPTGSAFTHVAAWPTTRAELLVKNSEPAGGKSYVLEAVWAANVATSIAAASAYTIVGQLVAQHVTDVTDNTAVLRQSLCGKSAYSGRARFAIANTAYGVASQWQVLGPSPTSAAASIGVAAYVDLRGLWIVPPDSIFLLNLVVGTATGTASIGLLWHEVELPLPL